MIEHDPRVRAAVTAAPEPLVFATISGAHLYGFASPDSDVDLRGVHLLDARTLLGLTGAPETRQRTDDVEGLELDLVTHDLGKFARMLLRPNGYVLEQLCSPLVVATSPLHAALLDLVPRLVTRRHARHYEGFARSQWARAGKEDPPRVKPVLYTYRVLLSGLHLLRTGEVLAHLPTLQAEAAVPDLDALLGAKREGAEAVTLPLDRDRHARRVGHLLEELAAAARASRLPERPSAGAELEELVVEARLATC